MNREADPEFEEVLCRGDLLEIRRASTLSSVRLKRYQALFELKPLHAFCSDVDVFLAEHEIPQRGVHCRLNEMSVAQTVQRLQQLGLWTIYVRREPLEGQTALLAAVTLPQLAAEDAHSDLGDCGFCWQKLSYRVSSK